jgi:hypothetical protein
MNLQDILSRYAGGNVDPSVAAQSDQHFDTVARSVPPDVLGQGVAGAFRSDQTPPFGQMLGQMFGQSNPQQKASVLNQLLGALGPAAASGIGGGLLGRVLGGLGGAGGMGGGLGGMGGSAGTSMTQAPTITPEQASQLSPDQVNEIATHAERHDPTIIDKIGDFYGQHPQLVKTLGSAALAIALGRIANRNNA